VADASRISKAAYFAVAAAAELARAGVPRLGKELAAAAGVPEIGLRKAMLALVRVGVADSERGRRGGYALTRPPGEITLLELVEAVDGPVRSDAGDDAPPAVAAACDRAAEAVRRELARVTLADLSGKRGRGT
jgi:Rrf2 family protein